MAAKIKINGNIFHLLQITIRKTKYGCVWCTLPDKPFYKPNITLITDSVKLI